MFLNKNDMIDLLNHLITTGRFWHLEYAEILVHDLENNEKVQIVDTPKALEIMATDEWSWEEE